MQYKITYLDSSGRKETETVKDTAEFYQRVRSEGLTIVKVEVVKKSLKGVRPVG